MKPLKVIIIGDSHLEHDVEPHPSYHLVKKFIADQKPDLLILNGDMLDLSYLSYFNEEKPGLRENKRLLKDINLMRHELNFFNKHAGDVVYLEGNHEYRLTRRVEQDPEMEEILSLRKLLDLDTRTFIEEIDQPVRVANSHLWVMHGKRYNIYLSAATLRDYMINIIIGHAHRIQNFTLRTFDRELGSWAIGCLTDKNPSYLNGKFAQAQNGFGIAYIQSNRNFTFNNIHIIDNSFVFENRVWA